MIRDKIKKLVKESVLCLKDDSCRTPNKIEIAVKRPPKEKYGDYFVSLRQDLAKEVLEKISKNPPEFLEKVEFLAPSFLNFFIKEDYFKKEVLKVLKEKENFGKVNIGKRKKTNVEFISANPTGTLHIGNGRGAFFGDVLSNLLSFAGFRVDREYYVNDAKNSNQIIELGKTALGTGKTYLTDDLQKKIKKLKKKVKDKEEGEAGYFLAQEVLKDIKKLTEKKLKVKFDKWFSEEKELLLKKAVDKTLIYLKEKKLVYKKDNALWLKTSKYGDEKDRVLVRKNGQPTYFLTDIAYHINKIKRNYKKIIDIWGADHQGHVARMKAVMAMLGYKGDFDVFISQIVNLKGGEKMSKRKGNVIYLADLIDEVGLDIARYFYISKSLFSHMEFDLQLAKEQSEKNPVYYIQYSYVRAESILKKAKKYNFKKADLKLLLHKSELKLIKELLKFPEIIEDTATDYQLQRLTEYARNIAFFFNQFYRDCRVLGEEKKMEEARLLLVFSTKIVLFNLFSLMGISVPKKM